MAYVDPSIPDPNYPDRPDHPDFVLLSNIIQGLDDLADDVPIALNVDTESLMYLMRGRIAMMGTIIPKSTPFEFQLMAAYAEGLTVGQRLEQARQRDNS